jgi:hypothetical protein
MNMTKKHAKRESGIYKVLQKQHLQLLEARKSGSNGFPTGSGGFPARWGGFQSRSGGFPAGSNRFHISAAAALNFVFAPCVLPGRG